MIKIFYSRIYHSNYHLLPGYFGGITSFSASQFRQINGFPNNFWGWGGEDDELYKRTKKVEIEFPTKILIFCGALLKLY